MVRNVIFDLIGRDKASPAFNSAGASATRMAGSVESSSRRMASATKTVGLAAAQLGLAFGAFELVKKAIDITKEAAEFQAAMTRIQTMTGATAAEVKGFSDALLQMSGKVAQAPEELATSLYHVYAATKTLGYTPAQMLNATEIAAKGATISGADLEETTNALTATMVAGLGKVNNMGAAMGALSAIVGVGDMKLQDLNEALGTGILAAAKGFGVTLNEAGAALAVFGDNNIRGADAATKLRMVMQDLAKPAAHADDVLSQIGLTAGDLRTALEDHGLSGAMNLLSTRMSKAGITANRVGGFIEDAFTKKAGVGLAVLLNNIDQYNEKIPQIVAGANNFGSAWEATTHTAKFALDSLSDSLTAQGIIIVNNVMPAVQTAAKWLGDELPAAISGLTGVLSGPLSAAWSVLTTAFSLAATVIAPVISLLDRFSGPLSMIATLVFGMWAAFKIGAAIPAILDTIALRALYMRDTFAAIPGKVTAAFTTTSLAANATASEIALAGGVASVGWRAMLGPLAAVGIGIGLLISMFHSSDHASKEAAEAAKAYTDALQDTSGSGTIFGTIVDQLKKNNVPALLDTVNEGLGRTAFNAGQFVTAIEAGDKPLAALRTRLEAVIKAGTSHGGVRGQFLEITPAAKAATAALGHLNAQYSGLSKAATQELATAKSFHMTATAVADVSGSMQVADKTAQGYLTTFGYVVDKNGIVEESSGHVHNAIALMNQTVNTATTSMSDFVQSWSQFAGTGGTAADRAAMIAATLKLANGDALSYAGAINAAAVASKGFADAVKQASGAQAAADKATKDGTSATAAVTAATRKYLTSVIDLKTGTINYKNAAAAPLISSLDQMQSAALNAAKAQFQHTRAQLGGKAAAASAYQTYVTQTRGSLIDQAKKLGLTQTQASKLATTYFGMPKDVKTLIEAEGGDPVVDILTRIGKMLATVFGVKWDAKLDADPTSLEGKTKAAQSHLDAVKQRKGIFLHLDKYDYDQAMIEAQDRLDNFKSKTITVNVAVNEGAGGAGHALPKAAGGSVWGPGTGTSDSIPARLSNGEFVVRASQARKHRGLLNRLNTPGFASGGSVDTSSVTGAIGAIGSTYTPKFNVADVGILRVLGQITAATNALNAAIGKGLGDKAAAAFRKQIADLKALAEAQLANLKLKIRTTDVTNLGKALLGTVDDAKAAFATLIGDAAHAGAPAARIEAMRTTEGKLLALQKQRLTVTTQLAAAQQKWNETYTAGRSAVMGTFDIASSGTSQTFGDRPATTTAGGILSSVRTAVANAGKFGAALKALVKAGLSKYLVAQLAAAGPSALPQALALMAATPDQIKSLNYNYGKLADTASMVGTASANAMYNAGTASGQGLIDGLKDKQSAITKQMQTMANNMVTALKTSLGIHSPSRVLRKMAHHTMDGYHLGMQDRADRIERSMKDIVNGGLPSGQSAEWQRSEQRGGHTFHIYEQSDPRAAADAMMRRLSLAGP